MTHLACVAVRVHLRDRFPALRLANITVAVIIGSQSRKRPARSKLSWKVWICNLAARSDRFFPLAFYNTSNLNGQWAFLHLGLFTHSRKSLHLFCEYVLHQPCRARILTSVGRVRLLSCTSHLCFVGCSRGGTSERQLRLAVMNPVQLSEL